MHARRTLVSVVALVLAGCASGGDFRGARDAGPGALDAPAPLDAPGAALDTGAAPLDAPAAPGDGGGVALDAPPVDAGSIGLDGGPPPPDAPVAPVDGGGGPVACTAATAGAVCGGRPCVDGFCCDGPCTGTCRACNVSGLQGTCAPEPAGTACDDGVACTHTDVCGAASACAGTTLSCSSTTCLSRACNGTPSCLETPRTGMTCDDGNGATTGDACQADGTCAGTTSSCTMPADACTTGSQSRDRCANARVIGRTSASASGGYVVSDSTCFAYNRFDTSCWDAGADHAYRLFVRAGETVVVRYEVDWSCPSYSSSFWDGTLKIYEAAGCADTTCATEVLCERYISSSFMHTYVAPRDGWIIIVADGSTAFDDEGDYTLRVTLSCGAGGCGC